MKSNCKNCKTCNGWGCVGQMPGLGGVNESKNFQLNCVGWRKLREELKERNVLRKMLNIEVRENQLSIGPVTGAEENIGFEHESDFYLPYFLAARNAKIGLCVGDGFPNTKLQFGLDAVKMLQRYERDLKAAFFIKPYSNAKMFSRIDSTRGLANVIGCDIDSYNIVTMRNLVHLEKKTARELLELKKYAKLPFAIKGVFLESDIELVKEVKPEIVFISNHGGRIETREGSTADFLAKYARELKNYCDEIWVDGGVRTKHDVQTALFFGADKVIIARPFIAALLSNGIDGMTKVACDLLGKKFVKKNAF